MQRKIIILLAALVVAFMFIGAASAATPVASKATVSTVPTGDQNNPGITASGPKVVWEQLDATTGLTNVWVKNTVTGNTKVVDAMAVNQAKPDIMADIVTWQQVSPASSSSDNNQIYIRNLTSGNWGLLSSTPGDDQINARLAKNPHDGFYAVWQEFNATSDSYQIFMKTVFTVGPGVEVQPNSGVDQTVPDASGNLVVWQEDTGLVMYKDLLQLDTGAIALPEWVNSGYEDQLNPRISGANVVWQEGAGTLSDPQAKIFLTNLNVLKSEPTLPAVATKALLPGAFLIFQYTPDISGNLITWSQTTALLVAPQVWVMNLATGNAKIVTTSLIAQITPAIDGNVVAWVQENPLFDTVYWRNIATGQHQQLA
jgi:hypothetical protein